MQNISWSLQIRIIWKTHANWSFAELYAVMLLAALQFKHNKINKLNYSIKHLKSQPI